MEDFNYLDGYMLTEVDGVLNEVLPKQIQSFLEDGFDEKNIQEYFNTRIQKEIKKFSEINDLESKIKAHKQKLTNTKFEIEELEERLNNLKNK